MLYLLFSQLLPQKPKTKDPGHFVRSVPVWLHSYINRFDRYVSVFRYTVDFAWQNNLIFYCKSEHLSVTSVWEVREELPLNPDITHSSILVFSMTDFSLGPWCCGPNNVCFQSHEKMDGCAQRLQDELVKINIWEAVRASDSPSWVCLYTILCSILMAQKTL